MEDIQDILQGFQFWKTCHIKRRGNRAAHTLVQVGVQQVLSCNWIDCIPEFIHSILISEFTSLIL